MNIVVLSFTTTGTPASQRPGIWVHVRLLQSIADSRMASSPVASPKAALLLGVIASFLHIRFTRLGTLSLTWNFTRKDILIALSATNVLCSSVRVDEDVSRHWE